MTRTLKKLQIIDDLIKMNTIATLNKQLVVDSFFQKICSPLGGLEIRFGSREKFPVNLNVIAVLLLEV